jgi:hypothetical protein
MANNKKYLLVILMVAMIWPINDFAQANEADFKIVDSNEYPDILSMLVSATQTNYENIKTWKGKIKSVDLQSIRGNRAKELSLKHNPAESNNLPEEIHQIITQNIEYNIDVENNRFFSFSKHTETPFYFDPKKNKTFPSGWKPEETQFIVTSENQIKISPLVWRGKDNAIIKRIAIKDYAGASQRIDPRQLFFIGSKTLWLTLSQLSQSLKITNTEKIGVVIKKNTVGGNTDYRIEAFDPGKDKPFSAFVLSSKDGYNRTYSENWYDNGSLMSKTTSEFVKIQGVFLPKKWTILQYYQDGSLIKQEDCMIEDQQINMPIPVDVFSENTYLRNGDKFTDNITHKEYKYQDANLILIEEPNKLPEPNNLPK